MDTVLQTLAGLLATVESPASRPEAEAILSERHVLRKIVINLS